MEKEREEKKEEELEKKFEEYAAKAASERKEEESKYGATKASDRQFWKIVIPMLYEMQERGIWGPKR